MTLVKPYRIALSVVCIALLGIGISGIVYHHDLQDAKADAISAIHDNEKAKSSLKTSIDNSAKYSKYQNNDVLPNDTGMVVKMSKSFNNANSDYNSSRYMQRIDSMNLGGAKAFVSNMKSDTARKNKESKSLDAIAKDIESSHAKRLVLDEQSNVNKMVDSARKQLSGSEGNVDDNTLRTELSNVINDAVKTVKTNDINAMKKIESLLNEKITAVQTSVKARAARIEAEGGAAAQTAANAAQQRTIQAAHGKSSYGSQNTTTRTSRSSGSPSMIEVSSSSSCNGDTSSDACQEYVDRGGFVNISYYNGASNVYAAHRGLGGSTVLGWHVGQKVSIDGKVYTVTNKRYNVGASDVPTSGTYAQTCNTDGGRVLVGLR